VQIPDIQSTKGKREKSTLTANDRRAIDFVREQKRLVCIDGMPPAEFKLKRGARRFWREEGSWNKWTELISLVCAHSSRIYDLKKGIRKQKSQSVE
jgi:hypothetical protein